MTIEHFFQSLPDNLRPIALELKRIILSMDPAIEERLAYNIPFYYGRSRICYLYQKRDQIELGFCKGHLMRDDGLLEVQNRKEVRSILFSSVADIDEESIRDLLGEAIEIDRRNAAMKATGKPKLT